MPRRAATHTVTSPAAPQAPPTPEQLETPYDSNIHQLRRHWKWAAFSQFFFTFSPLLAMGDVTVTDVENDLVHSTNRVLSRIMQRLLVTLTQDRKITADSWQNALRRQYQRRDPEASPIGLLGRSYHAAAESSRASTALPTTLSEAPPDEAEQENKSLQRDMSAAPSPDVEDSAENMEHVSSTKLEEEEDTSELVETLEKQSDWLDLSMLAKLESLHTLAEWQFQNPHRVRQQMKTDDELATWRIEPIGYDARRNAYWLIGSDRLWIQREPPTSNLKRKRKPGGNPKNAANKQPRSSSMKHQRIDLDPEFVKQSSVARPTRSKTQSQLALSPREGRAAKTRANQRLDAQARDVVEFRHQMIGSRTRITLMTPRNPTGTRVSARLRGTAVKDDEWQQVPDEWLTENDARQRHVKDLSSVSPPGKKKMKTGLESENSSVSELTELSDGEDDAVRAARRFDDAVMDVEEMAPILAEKDTDAKIEARQDEEAIDPSATPLFPHDFVEWETICVTLEEWESIGQQFEKASHYAEKALHKVLLQHIVPMVTAELREAEKQRRVEEAVVHRKRSSRIAMKEFEKEEQRAAVRKRAEEDEKMSRARRLEARLQKGQAERLKRENARELRRKEGESQEQSAETPEAESKVDIYMDVTQEEASSNLPPLEQSMGTPNAAATNGTGSGSRTPVENWLLDCEVCGGKGTNQDGGVPLLCCEKCGRWQHIICHDKQDSMTGRPKRNWDSEDFMCQQCRPISSNNSSVSSPATFLSSGPNSKKGQALGNQAHYVAPSNHLRNSGVYQDPSSNARYPYDRSDPSTVPSTHSYGSQTHSTSVTFAHYQPQLGGFSTSQPTYSVQNVSPSQHSRYTSQTLQTGMTPYPSTAQPQAMTHPPAHTHEQWHASSYPRTTNSYPLNGGASHPSQGPQSYYNGHTHTSYSHIRGTTGPTVLGQYAGLRHVSSYQHSK